MWSWYDICVVAEKQSNKVKKAVREGMKKLTNEEYDGDSERYKDKKSKKYTTGP